MSTWQRDMDIRFVAEHAVDSCLQIATSVIAMDPLRVFVYLDPRTDDKRPIKRRSSTAKRRSSERKSASSGIIQPNLSDIRKVQSTPDLSAAHTSDNANVKYKLTKSNSQVFNPSLKSVGRARMSTRASRHKRNLRKSTTSYFVRDSIFSESSFRHDSVSSYIASKFQFIMNEPFQANYEDDAPDDMPASLRSTLEDVLLTDTDYEALRPASVWSYALSGTSSSSESELEINLEATEEEIEALINFEWQSIKNFSIAETVCDIRNFVSMWRLSPHTKFYISSETPLMKSILGTKYYVTVAFSKPTPSNPNPLAVAYTLFEVHVSFAMPEDYPIMITYHFEGYKTNYHLMGQQNMRSITFQKYFIDAILNMKLAFYTEIFEWNFGSVHAKPKKFTDQEENDMFEKQAVIDKMRYKLNKDIPNVEPHIPPAAKLPELQLPSLKNVVRKVYEQSPPRQTFWDLEHQHIIASTDKTELWKWDLIEASKYNRKLTIPFKMSQITFQMDENLPKSTTTRTNETPLDRDGGSGLSVFGLNKTNT